MKPKYVFLALLGGLIYVWIGTLYISVIYSKFDFYDDVTICLFTDGFLAIMQALGYVIFMLFIRNNKKALTWWVPAIESVIIYGTGVGAFLAKSAIASTVLGSIMSFFIGTLMCYVITGITFEVEYSHRGKAFGIIYAVGSVGSFLLSILDGGDALGKNYILIIYGGLAAVSIVLGRIVYAGGEENIFRKEEYLRPVKTKPAKRDALLFYTIFMFFVLSNIGLHFKISGGAEFVSAIFSRAFYAIGLIVAGFINDKNRKIGAMCAFLALGFGLLSPALQINAGVSVTVQSIAYIFLGFPAVYRMIIFSDEAEKDHKKFPFAAMGVVAALVGQAVGTLMGVLLEHNMTLLVCVMLVLYIITGIGFFSYFALLYPKQEGKEDKLPEGDRKEMVFEQYVKEKGLNVKQAQILKYILEGDSNGEIAEKLFVAESTVKYHVKNILQASSCHNRKELIDDVRNRYLNS